MNSKTNNTEHDRNGDLPRDIAWHDLSEYNIYGRYWTTGNCESCYDRLPRIVKDEISPKGWYYSKYSSGMCFHFKSNATALWINYTLGKEWLSLTNMTTIAVSGFDLYAKSVKRGWQSVAVTMPKKSSCIECLISDVRGTVREYMLYFPLYNSVQKVLLGVRRDRDFRSEVKSKRKPIVIYGSSITQGGSASRPGLAYPAILSRLMGAPTVNLGLSGCAYMEPIIAKVMSGMDASVYIVDALENIKTEDMYNKCLNFLTTLSHEKRNTPIYVLEDHAIAHSWIKDEFRASSCARRKIMNTVLVMLRRSGYQNIKFLKSDELLPTKSECFIDTKHITDMGFIQIANNLENEIKNSSVL